MGAPEGTGRITFVGKVSTSGKDKVVIVVPKELWSKITKPMKKNAMITIEEIRGVTP